MVNVINQDTSETCYMPQMKWNKALEITCCETMYYVRVMAKYLVLVRAVVDTTNNNHIRIYTVNQSWEVVATVTICPVSGSKTGRHSINPTLRTVIGYKPCILLNWRPHNHWKHEIVHYLYVKKMSSLIMAIGLPYILPVIIFFG